MLSGMAILKASTLKRAMPRRRRVMPPMLGPVGGLGPATGGLRLLVALKIRGGYMEPTNQKNHAELYTPTGAKKPRNAWIFFFGKKPGGQQQKQ